MADGMDVHPEALRQRSPKFAEAADKLAKAFDELQRVRDAEEGCWGQDDSGKKFDEEYAKATADVDKGRIALGDGLNGTKDELNKTADQWESDDQSSAGSIHDAGSMK